MNCKHCGSNETIFRGIDGEIKIYCYNCNHYFNYINKKQIDENLTKIKDNQTISNTLYIVTEELGELIQAIQKYQRYLSGDKTLRNKSNKILDNLKEEIVDNYITVTQLAKIIEFDEIDFDSRVMEKTERTIKLLGIE